MNRPFAPRMKDQQETYKGQPMWVVDCRQWGPLMKRMGHPLRRRFADKTAAEAWCRQLIRDEATGRRADPGPVAVRDLSAVYLKSIEKSERTEATHRTYTSRMNRFLTFLDTIGVEDVRDVSPAVVEQYRLDCHDKLTAYGAAGALTIPHGMFRWAVAKSFVDWNPLEGVERPRPKSERRSFSDDELKTLMRGARQANLPIWRLFLLTGLRRREMANLHVADVELVSPAPFIRVMGKGKKRRNVPLLSEARQIATSMVRDAKKAGREQLLPTGYQGLGYRWATERERLKLPADLVLHSLRHTFATSLVNRTGTPLTEACRVLGHSSVLQTQAYVHEDEARLRRGMAELEEELHLATGDESARQSAEGGI